MGVVHILKEGKSYCGFPGTPERWPNDHRWILPDDLDNLPLVTCPDCRRIFQMEKHGGRENMEIRRCFLVNSDLLPKSLPNGHMVVQGYLSKDPLVRIRVLGDCAWIAIRGRGDPVEYPSWEYSIPWQEAEQILKLTPKITKICRNVIHKSHVWRLDEFLGANVGLWMAKIELSDKYESYETPEWVTEEVSYNQKYYQNLAKKDRV